MAEHTPFTTGGTVLGLDTLDLSLQFLMTRYARNPDPETARAVTDHLLMLLGHPAVADNIGYRELYNRLLATWRPLGEPERHSRKAFVRVPGFPINGNQSGGGGDHGCQ